MTYSDTKQLLEDYIAQRRIASRLMTEIAYMPVLNQSITSTIKEIVVQNGTPPCLRLEIKLKEKQKQLENQVEKYLEIEDRLIPAINNLPTIQQDIIIGYYMQGKPHFKLAQECNYSLRQIINIKNAGIENLSKLL